MLGLTTEVNKLSQDEQLKILMWSMEDLEGRLPLAVTVSGTDASTQIKFAKQASDFWSKLVDTTTTITPTIGRRRML